MPSTNHPQQICKYGIAHAENLYTLSELVNSQIKKGYQPTPGGVQYMPHGEVMLYVQVMVQYLASYPLSYPPLGDGGRDGGKDGGKSKVKTKSSLTIKNKKNERKV